MIVTGPQIEQDVENGRIILIPFQKSALNPNSYNYRLGRSIECPVEGGGSITEQLPDSGYVLRPRRTYLAHTLEVIGSPVYAMSLIGRSSIGRRGLFLTVSAEIEHTASCHRWTLEMFATNPFRVYPGMVIGQVSFWLNKGPLVPLPSIHVALNESSEVGLERER